MSFFIIGQVQAHAVAFPRDTLQSPLYPASYNGSSVPMDLPDAVPVCIEHGPFPIPGAVFPCSIPVAEYGGCPASMAGSVFLFYKGLFFPVF